MKSAWILVLVAVGCSRADKNATERTGTTSITFAPITVRADPNEPLARRVDAALAHDPATSLAAKDVEIVAIDDVVTLHGSVADPATKASIERVVRAVPGVRETLNALDVSPSRTDAQSDDAIAYSLQRDLALDRSIAADSDRVTIDVQNGIVTLRGATSTDARRSAVERVAEGTPGVVTVVDDLEVKPR